MYQAYIGLGSNLKNPQRQIITALTAIQDIASNQKIRCSSIYQSKAMGDIHQPDYLNAVVAISTDKSALDLLDSLQEIENNQGRERFTQKWSARTLDLDLLLYDDQMINLSRLTVPHYGLQQRNFVIYPLAEIAPDLVLPDGTPIKDLSQTCSANGIHKID